MSPIINISTGFKNSAIGIIKISFGKINNKFIYFFFKKFFYKILKIKIINYIYFYNFKNIILDKGISIYFKKPNSYTGENLIEMHFHGNINILKNILKINIFFFNKYGLRISKKGEFSKKAFYNSKINIFDLEYLLFFFNYKKKIFSLNFLSDFIFLNFKNKILKILKKIKYLEIINFNNTNKILKYKNIYFYNINYIKKEIFFLIKKFNFNKKNKNIVPILGFVNTGKSTLINKISNKNNSIVSSSKGTTRDILEKKIIFEKNLYYFLDTPGFNNFQNIIEYLGIVISLKKIFFSKIIVYVLDNLRYYNYYYYYIKKNIKINQLFLKLINKIDFLKNFSCFEILLIKNLKKITLKISSKLKIGLFFFLNEFKKKFSNFLTSKSIIFKILKKSYFFINRILIFFLKNKYFFFLKELLKLKKFLNFILFKKNKSYFNKIFKKFCIGK